MPEVIKRRDIAEEDLYKDVRKSSEATIKTTIRLNKELIENARIIEKDLNKAVTNSAKGMRDFVKLTEKASKSKKEAIRLDKQEATAIKQKGAAEMQLEKIKQQKLKTETLEIRNAALLRTQKEKQAKAQQKAAKAAGDEANAYKRLVKRTRDQKNESKKLAAQMIALTESGRRNSTEYKKLAATYRQVTAAAQKGDKSLKKIDATVGDNFRHVGKYSNALGGLKAGLIRMAGALGAFRALRGIGDIVVKFDQAQGDLLAISGKTEDQLESLTKQAKELGATTQFSATQITEMQIELAKLGFSTDAIGKSTSAVANFAAATGAAIPEAAALAGSALRGFGLKAAEMERVVSTLGVATTKSALDFAKLQTGLSTVAPVASAFGFSIEDTTALLGGLANAGFDASSSATATRNILLNLADANGDLAKKLGRPINNLDDLTEGLNELQESGIDLGEALELTDKRSVAAFETFLKGGDSLIKLRDGISGANDELEAMAAKKLDTITGQFTLLSSAWEGFILKLNEGSGAGETIKNVLGSLAKNLDTILAVVGFVVKAFLIYKTRLIALNVAQKLFNSGAGKMVFSLKNIGKNLKENTKAGTKMGSALRGIGWAALIAFAASFVGKLWDIVTGQDAIMRTAARMKKIEEEQAEQREAFNQEFAKQLKHRREAMNLDIIDIQRKANEEIKAGKKIATVRKKEKEDIEAVRKVYEDYLKDTNKAGRDKIDVLTDDISTHESQITVLKGVIATREKLGRGVGAQQVEIKELEELIKFKQSEIELRTSALTNLKEETDAKEENRKAGVKSTVTAQKRNIEFKKTIDLLRELNDETDNQIILQQRLNEITSEREIKDIQALIDKEIELQRVRAGENGGFDFTKVLELSKKRLALETEAIETRRDFEILTAKQANSDRFADMRADLAAERAELLAQDKLTTDERAKIEANFQAELAKIKTLEIDAAITVEDEIKVIKAESNAEIIDLEKQTADEIIEIEDELVDEAIQAGEKKAEAAQKTLDEIVAAEKIAADRRKAIAQALADFLTKKSDQRIAELNKEKTAAEKQADFLRSLAIQGNIEASQSLAENARIVAEANRKIAAEEKRKQRIQLANAAYQSYTANVAAGSETPLADTITDIALLQAFINSLPAFESGTENTGANGAGVDGKGGFFSVLHPYERVMDAENNAKVPAGMSNDQLAQIAQDYDTGKIMGKNEGAAQMGGAWHSAVIVDRLNSVENAIRSQPDITLEIEKITEFVAYINTKRTAGNHTVFNRNRLDT